MELPSAPVADTRPVWLFAVDPKTNRRYYYNRITKQRTWYKPPEFFEPVWIETLDVLSGRHYYYNRKTQESTWRRPSYYLPMDPDTTKGIQACMARLQTLYTLPSPRNSASASPRSTGSAGSQEHSPTPPERRDPLPRIVDVKYNEQLRDVKREQREGCWKQVLDPRSGQKYYYHTKTKERRWEKPDEYISISGVKKRRRRANERKKFRRRRRHSQRKRGALGGYDTLDLLKMKGKKQPSRASPAVPAIADPVEIPNATSESTGPNESSGPSEATASNNSTAGPGLQRSTSNGSQGEGEEGTDSERDEPDDDSDEESVSFQVPPPPQDAEPGSVSEADEDSVADPPSQPPSVPASPRTGSDAGSDAGDDIKSRRQWTRATKQLHRRTDNSEPVASVYFGQWRRAFDPALGRQYFFHEITKEVRWDAPSVPPGVKAGESDHRDSPAHNVPDDDEGEDEGSLLNEETGETMHTSSSARSAKRPWRPAGSASSSQASRRISRDVRPARGRAVSVDDEEVSSQDAKGHSRKSSVPSYARVTESWSRRSTAGSGPPTHRRSKSLGGRKAAKLERSGSSAWRP